MADVQTTNIFEQGQRVLMVLKRYTLPSVQAALPLEAARQELTAKIEANKDSNSTWGYFPEITGDNFPYTASKRLAAAVHDELLVQDPDYDAAKLAFVRLATSEPDSTFGGVHVDVSPGIAHEWAPGVDKNSNILRVLFNVFNKPRRLEYYPYTVGDLRQQGEDIPHDNYKILNLPESLELKSIEIPPADDQHVYALCFFSNLVPHAGRTNSQGHFLVSFGGYVAPDFELVN